MALEHKLIQGGDEWLPFARSRVKALRSSGLKYASQKFDVGNATVRVRIEPGHDYIDVQGNEVAYIWVMLTMTEAWTRPVGPYTKSDKTVSTQLFRIPTGDVKKAELYGEWLDAFASYEKVKLASQYTNYSTDYYHAPKPEIGYPGGYYPVPYTKETGWGDRWTQKTGSDMCPSNFAPYGKDAALYFSGIETSGSAYTVQTRTRTIVVDNGNGNFLLNYPVQARNDLTASGWQRVYRRIEWKKATKSTLREYAYTETSFAWVYYPPDSTPDMPSRAESFGGNVASRPVFLKDGVLSTLVSKYEDGDFAAQRIVSTNELQISSPPTKMECLPEVPPPQWNWSNGPVSRLAALGDHDYVDGETRFHRYTRREVNHHRQGVDFIQYDDYSNPKCGVYGRDNIRIYPPYPVDIRTIALSPTECIRFDGLSAWCLHLFKGTESMTIDLREMPGLSANSLVGLNELEISYVLRGNQAVPNNWNLAENRTEDEISPSGDFRRAFAIQVMPDQKALFRRGAVWFRLPKTP